MKVKVDIRETIPVRRSHILTEQGDDGHLVLAYPRFPYRWLNKLFPMLSTHIHVPLEKYGSSIWNLIDGQHSVEEIAESAAILFPEEQDIKNRAVAYIQQLHRDKFIWLKV
ncbi:MAG: PqqD family protein [Bacteroidaceae bacterium]|nr:PqqD family protein [Bacteroidaceae bacterium]